MNDHQSAPANGAWKYVNHGSTDQFAMSVILPQTMKVDVPASPSVVALHDRMAQSRMSQKITLADGEVGAPEGELSELTAWRGMFAEGKSKFRVTKLEVFDGGMIVWCSGDHSGADIQLLLAEANKAAQPPPPPMTQEQLHPSVIVYDILSTITQLKTSSDAMNEGAKTLERLEATLLGEDIEYPVTLDEARQRVMNGGPHQDIWHRAVDRLMVIPTAEPLLSDLIEETATIVTAEQVGMAWKGSLAASVQLVMWDSKYRAVPRDVWKRILAESDIDAIPYEAEWFDCDDYARQFAAECSMKHRINGAGWLADQGSGHAYSALLCSDPISIMFIEPQKDGLIENASKNYSFKNGLAQF